MEEIEINQENVFPKKLQNEENSTKNISLTDAALLSDYRDLIGMFKIAKKQMGNFYGSIDDVTDSPSIKKIPVFDMYSEMIHEVVNQAKELGHILGYIETFMDEIGHWMDHHEYISNLNSEDFILFRKQMGTFRLEGSTIPTPVLIKLSLKMIGHPLVEKSNVEGPD